MTPTWIEGVHARAGVVDVAEALGLRVHHGTLAPCPACGAERRGSQDARGPVGLGDVGWRCHRCQATGDALTLAAIAVAGEPKPRDWTPVRAWLASRGWCSSDDTASAPTLRPPRPRPAPAPPRRPPAEEVAALWRACGPVTQDLEVAAWLRLRGLDPATCEDLDLVRALPAGPLPRWAWGPGGAWGAAGYRAVLPLFDAHGRMTSLRARAVRPVERKALAPAGHQVAGLVLADGLGRRMLAGDVDARELVLEAGLVVAEGEPDMLTWATRWGVDAGLERAPAVIGVESGAWTDDVAAAVPRGTRVVLWTHSDDAGDGYAADVERSLHGLCWVQRHRAEAA